MSSPGNCLIGNNVHINRNAFIRAEGGLSIGENTHISRNVVIYTVNHCYEGERLPYDERHVHKPVNIGRNVWIGMNVCITPGVSIGDGAIIGMGAVVNRDVPARAIVRAPSAKVARYRDEERYHRLDANGRYAGMSGFPYEKH